MADSLTRDNPAIARLLSFFQEMTVWETNAAEQYSKVDWANTTEAEYDRGKNACKEVLKSIFAKYCEAGAEAERLRDEGLAYRLGQPKYDPQRDTIVEISEKRGVVTAVIRQECEPRWLYRYHLVQRDGQWWIRDRRERRVGEGGPWKRDIL